MVRKYYEMVPKPSEKVSLSWKVAHMTLAFVATCTSALAATSFQDLSLDLGGMCLVNTKLVFLPMKYCYIPVGDYKLDISFLTTDTIWGNNDTCQLIVLAYNTSLTLGFVLFFFLFLLPKGGQDTLFTMSIRGDVFVFPSMIMSLVLACVMFVVNETVAYNTNEFCRQVVAALNLPRCTNSKINELTLSFNKVYHNMNNHIHYLRLSSPVVLYSWLLLFVSFLARIFVAPDFMVNVYTLSKPKKRRRFSSIDSLFEDDICRRDCC